MTLDEKRIHILNELEEYKNKLLREMSGCDKATLSKLREIMCDYYNIKNGVDNIINEYEKSVQLNKAEYERDLADIKNTFEKDIKSTLYNFVMEDYARNTIARVVTEYVDDNSGGFLTTTDIANGMGYDSTKTISQKGITELIYRFIKPLNLNHTSFESGTLDFSDGKTAQHNFIMRSNDFISVDGNTLYQIYSERLEITDTQFVFEYDENKSFIRFQTVNSDLFENGITTHENTRYIKIRTQSFTTADELPPITTNVMVEKNDVKSHSFDGVNPILKIFSDNIMLLLNSIKNYNINNTKLVYGTLNYSNGAFTRSDVVMCTDDFISVDGNTIYQIYSERMEMKDTQFVFEYDENKSFIRFQTIISDLFESGITTHENTRYIKIRTQTNDTNYELPLTPPVIMVEKGGVKTNRFNSFVLDKLVLPFDESVFDYALREFDTRLKNLESKFKDSDFILSLETLEQELMCEDYDLGFLAVTDTHTIKEEIFEIMGHFANNHIGDFVVNMGDNTHDKPTKEEKAKLLKNLFEVSRKGGGLDIYHLRGNHDNNPVSKGENAFNKDYHLPEKSFYNIATRNANNVVKKYPHNYYYRDFDSCKIRVIFMDSGDIYKENGDLQTDALNVMYQQKQITWFINEALNLNEKVDKNEWSVVTISHSFIVPLEPIVNAFLNGSSYSGSYNYYYAFTPFDVDLSCDFSDQGAIDYIAHISGHEHEDVVNALNGVNPPRYSITVKNAIEIHDEPLSENISIDFITINKSSRTIKTHRIGNGEDRTISY